MKRLIILIASLCASVVMFAQDPTGGITGKVVNRQGRTPVEGAEVTVLKASVALDAVESGRLDLSHYLLDQWRLMHIGAQPAGYLRQGRERLRA